MKVAVFSTKPFDRAFLEKHNSFYGHKLIFFEERLTEQSTALAISFRAVCVFVNDQLNSKVLTELLENGTSLIALRGAGFNNVDIVTAGELGLTVVRVPEYSPYAVAEHTVALIMALNRRVCRAHSRVREGNFSLEGLLGFELHGSTIGIVGTGRIGKIVAKILNGFGCVLLAFDPSPNSECRSFGVKYVSLDELYSKSDVITLHCPLMPRTCHMISAETISRMKTGVMLINTSRGALIDTKAVIEALKSGKIGYLGLDVYEEEADLFFEDLSNQIIQDDVLARLLTFPNVIITSHQAFFTRNALESIAKTTLANITDFEKGQPCANEINAEIIMR
ncbi:D-lactate dehydrogenase [subsurface metagenome]